MLDVYGRTSRILAIFAVTCLMMGTVLALFSFRWYHDGVESFGGNLSSGLDADEKEVWYANYDSASPGAQKINVYDTASGEWTKSFSGGPDGIPISEFRFVDIEGSKALVGGPKGGALYDRDSDKWTSLDKAEGLTTIDLYSGTLHNGEIWLGTNDGVARRDSSGNWQFMTTADGLPNPKVLDFEFDGDAVWICTEAGVLHYNMASGEKKAYGAAEGMPGSACRKALVDGDNVWFALKGGIARLNKNDGTITSYSAAADGILSDEVKDIAVVGNRIYFATNKGVNYIDREKEGKFKKITTKQGLPDTPARKGLGSDATHLAVEGDALWIALWYEGIVRMTIPTGLAIIPVWVWVVALGVLGVVALIIIRPGAKKGEVSAKEKEIKERREKVRTAKPPWETCGGVPQRQLCNRCKFNALKAGKLFCGKYNIPIDYKPTGGGAESDAGQES